MKKITLDEVIKEHQQKDPIFAECYEKELLINALSKMVIAVRNSAHFSQAELAEKAHTTQPVIARLESGQDSRLPSLPLLARIAVASHARLHIDFEMEDLPYDEKSRGEKENRDGQA